MRFAKQDANFLPSIGNCAQPVLVILIHPKADYAGKNILLRWRTRDTTVRGTHSIKMKNVTKKILAAHAWCERDIKGKFWTHAFPFWWRAMCHLNTLYFELGNLFKNRILEILSYLVPLLTAIPSPPSPSAISSPPSMFNFIYFFLS